MGIIVKVNSTEMRKDSRGIIACLLLREIMTGIWVEKISKGDFEHKVGTYQIVRPTRGNKQKVIDAVETIVNGCSGLDRKIAYMEVNSIWNGKKCFDVVEALESHIAKLNVDDFKELKELKEKSRVCVELLDGLSEKKGITKYIKLIVATIKFGKYAKKFAKLVKSIFAKSHLDISLELSYNLRTGSVEIDAVTKNEKIPCGDINKQSDWT